MIGGGVTILAERKTKKAPSRTVTAVGMLAVAAAVIARAIDLV
jgi:predicted transcriptional regulator